MLIALNKPFGVLCQFSDRAGDAAGEVRRTLAELVAVPGVYPAGRLDADSEGLLLLTDEGPLAARITDPKHAWAKTYLAQVDGVPGEAALARLRRGIELNDGPTRPAEVRLLAKAPGWLWKREPPIRQRKHLPTAWLEIVLREGRNRQVRRMTAAVGLPTLRLIRSQIGPYPLGPLTPGQWRRIA
jgi:23S rRNA pseudouridine2457 synthase